MTGRNAGFQVIARELFTGGRLSQVKHPSCYSCLVPPGTVLFVQPQQVTVSVDAGWKPGGSAGVDPE